MLATYCSGVLICEAWSACARVRANVEPRSYSLRISSAGVTRHGRHRHDEGKPGDQRDAQTARPVGAEHAERDVDPTDDGFRAQILHGVRRHPVRHETIAHPIEASGASVSMRV
jgi:hypothetical protein